MRQFSRSRYGLMVLSALVLVTAGCARGCTSRRPPIHIVPNMDNQPRYEAQASSNFFYDGKTMRTPVAGTVARTNTPFELLETVGYSSGQKDDGTFIESIPVPVDDALLARGEDRYAIYCEPCHDPRGTGRGILFERGGVPTTSLHDPRLLEAVDGQIFDTITNGVGLMAGYRYPIRIDDRWAIVAYVRRLQAGN